MSSQRRKTSLTSVVSRWLLVDVQATGGYSLLYVDGQPIDPGDPLRPSLQSKRDREILLRALDSVVTAGMDGLDSTLVYQNVPWRIKIESKRSPGTGEIVGLWAIYSPTGTDLPPIPFELGGWEWDLKDLQTSVPAKIHWDDQQRRIYGDPEIFRDHDPDMIQWLTERVSLVDSTRLAELAAKWQKKDFTTRHLVKYEINVRDSSRAVRPRTLWMSARLYRDPDGSLHFKGFSYPDPATNSLNPAPTMSSLGMMDSFRKLFTEFAMITYDAVTSRSAVVSPSYTQFGLVPADQPVERLVLDDDRQGFIDGMRQARSGVGPVVIKVRWKKVDETYVWAEVRLILISSVPASDRYLAIGIKPEPSKTT